MPTVDAAVDERAGGRFRLGPAGVLGVAVGAALLTAIIIALTMLVTRPAQQAGPPGGGSVVGTSPVPTQPSTTGTIGDVRTVIQAQVQSGQIDSGAANDLLNTLDEIERHVADDRLDKAAEQIEKIRDRVEELARDGKITRAGEAAVVESLDELARSLPEDGDDGDDGDDD